MGMIRLVQTAVVLGWCETLFKKAPTCSNMCTAEYGPAIVALQVHDDPEIPDEKRTSCKPHCMWTCPDTPACELKDGKKEEDCPKPKCKLFCEDTPDCPEKKEALSGETVTVKEGQSVQISGSHRQTAGSGGGGASGGEKPGGAARRERRRRKEEERKREEEERKRRLEEEEGGHGKKSGAASAAVGGAMAVLALCQLN
mmetsp:Transcript_22412/g.48949  ORF Transcript_22412/g.48949 Transcript_22412/m.48949 type:complete len:199 (-) Transcript_22412:176-772(-)